ncbi:hypothetical protein [Vreelandella nanhaiensis]|uniref:Uncharacterized protein n=1 Tax=Vreelandella nanhaiensis TaxID=1258546 RepID=A0A3S0XZB2_9GAMM|nr:hypothetical protein [Halomonas nanhaiensis]RUR28169.1 hypothetical protein ELY38_17495 [Halomonas nanhaiensis]
MISRLWMPAIATLALLLSACGDSQEEASLAPDEPSSVAEDEVVQEQEAPAAAENAAQMPSPEEVEDDVEARQAAEELERAEALRGDMESEVSAPEASVGEEVEADESTLAADPDDVLEEGGAMPGEATRSDVDQMIEETEQRFQEAQRRLEEQFQEVEQQGATQESFDEETFSTEWEVQSSLPDNSRLDDNLEATDVDALLEDTERRFEEAQQRLEEQFKEIEREHNDSHSRGAILNEGADVETSESTEADETAPNQ